MTNFYCPLELVRMDIHFIRHENLLPRVNNKACSPLMVCSFSMMTGTSLETDTVIVQFPLSLRVR